MLEGLSVEISVVKHPLSSSLMAFASIHVSVGSNNFIFFLV